MCGLEFPDIEKNLYKKYADKGLVIVGVNPGKIMMGGESAAMVQMFGKQTSVTFPLGFDNGESYKLFRYGKAISPFPLDVVIDKNGKVAYFSREYDSDKMTKLIEQLLAD